MSQNNTQRGFTVIELTLAMAFLAFILLFTTTTLVQMMRTYNKGITIKQINQAGRTITEDLARSLGSGESADIITTYLPQGRLCVGNAVYMWTPTFTAAQQYTPTIYTRLDTKAVSLVRASKTPLTCSANGALSLASSDTTFSLLGDNARVLDVKAERYGTGGRLVQLTFIIGTFDLGEESALQSLATATPQYNNIYNTPYYRGGTMTCRPDSQGNFCAFGTFKTTVYVGN